jgi:hypothetical protein
MDISSSVNLTQLSTAGTQGDNVRQDYGVAVATKINQQVKQDGDDATKLLESVSIPSSDDKRGKNLAAYA